MPKYKHHSRGKKTVSANVARQKGISHIDFAMAVSVMIVTIAFSTFYVSGYFSQTSANDKTGDLQASSSSLEKILFDSAGIPENWENNNYAPVRAGLKGGIPRIAIAAAEAGGVNHSFEEADVHIVFDGNCLNTTYNNSIRIYDRFMNETAFRIYNYTECTANSGFLREANINFLFNITGNTSTVFWLYYMNDTATPKKSVYNFSYDISLVGYWKLDSVNASNHTLDSTGYHNDGKLINYTCNPSTCNLTAGQKRNGLSFDGVNDYVDAGNESNVQLANGTVGAWFKTSNAGTTWRGIVTKQLAYGLFLNGNKLSLYDWGTSQERATNIILNDSNWHYAAVTFQSGVTNGTLIYVDGILRNTTTITVNLQTVAVKIGQGGSNVQYFNGTIDEVRIYNRSLSADEIKALYNYTKPSYVTSSGTFPVITHKKISAAQNLSYSGLKASLDMKKNFNITACEYGFGGHVPDTVSVTSSSYPIMLLNSSGSVKPCLATVNIW